MDVAKRVGAKVRELREAQALSQEELAHRAGLHRTYVSQVERATKNATLASAERIAKALGVSLAVLVDEG